MLSYSLLVVVSLSLLSLSSTQEAQGILSIKCWDTTNPESTFGRMKANCEDGTSVNYCGCNTRSGRPNVCPNSKVVSASGVGCGLWNCGGNQVKRLVKPANPEAGICCPSYECVTPSPSDCWNTSNPATSFGRMKATCEDGTTSSNYCGCNTGKGVFPSSVCPNSKVVAWNGVGCPSMACPLGHTRRLIKPADPESGRCCPHYQCVALTEEQCWDTTNKAASFSRTKATCEDGSTSTEFCSCNSRQQAVPSSVCPNSKVVSLSAVGCASFLCPLGSVKQLVKAADPKSGKCCPTYDCVPVPTNDDQCWDSSKTPSEGRRKATCEDGSTSAEFCACNGKASAPSFVCPNSKVVGVSGVGCPLFACGPNMFRRFVKAADPKSGQCCPTYECAPLPKADAQVDEQANSVTNTLNNTSSVGIAFIVLGAVFAVVLVVFVVLLAKKMNYVQRG